MKPLVCIHGHFYQPPRENPWLEAIELQDSAYPYHDWNERITAECYAPNATARILDEDKRIRKIVNNYSWMSFNFGPTLLSWLEARSPRVYRAILEADAESRKRFSGHGSAIAQVYNHMIMPLANTRDRVTQVRWGLADFEKRFGRKPEGMWLAETAVDIESLEILADHGIRYTILAPRQARRVRKAGGRWKDVPGDSVDPRMAYEQKLPSGRSIALFFYDGPVSRAVAFEGLLGDGRRLADRILGAASAEEEEPQLLHIATDGETYGHHHRHGDMALAWAIEHMHATGKAVITNYGEFLEMHPPQHQAEIREKSSWSCAHGIDRWWSDCGCNSGGNAGWNQGWRTGLRDALDWLRDGMAEPWAAAAGRLFRDPWAARDAYIDVVLDRSAENRNAFLAAHAVRALSPEDTVEALELLELQRHAMLMYTSCGWFFDELSGIETVQVIQYAGRAVQLAGRRLGRDFESGFVEKLAAARSNIPEVGDGAAIYRRFVTPAAVDMAKLAAHYATSSLFENYPDRAGIYCYAAEREAIEETAAGNSRLLLGRARFTSNITAESGSLSFGVIHFGDHNIQAGVRTYQGDEAFGKLVAESTEAFSRGDMAAALRCLDRHFDGVTLSLRSLFRDEQRRIVNLLLEKTREEAESGLSRIYERNAPLMRFLGDLRVPLPAALQASAEFVLNSRLLRALSAEAPDGGAVRALLKTAREDKVALDGPGLGFALGRTLEAMMDRLVEAPADQARLDRLLETAGLLEVVPFEVNLWLVQNGFYDLLVRTHPEVAARDDAEASRWVTAFGALGERLSVRVP